MKEYEEKYQETKAKHLVLWKDLISKIFDGVPTSQMTITDRSHIVRILHKIGSSEADNHTFMPAGGGDDLTDSVFSSEDGRIELNFSGNVLIVNPTKLSFHPIGENPEWWYFRLDTSSFNRSKVYEDQQDEETNTHQLIDESELHWSVHFNGEEVLELTSGEYEDRSLWEEGFLGYDEDGREIKMPDTARIVTRMINGGSFVIFPKYSLYNRNSATYDGRHNKVTNEEFASYIKDVVASLDKK
ncbi:MULTISPECIES: hypothetical protein [Bacillus]|nr:MULTISPECIES: hypothetical protein [Bacillus]AOL29132.1 serine/threonine protein kinase [Alkalicoccobacillus gibsonii]ADV96189.1 serine/threonine protein kinase [Bacillus subtilis BSn5]AOL27953.1 serine/threonine protein kinase [Bacillus sp. FJAT-14266]ASC84179.1 serine/threonine protein kinase [Bacillus subtilis]AXP47882.1 serine/threonine protein kinase [Bacillus subtilis subsp. subtilis]